MSDDGSGHQINIPSFFIRKKVSDGIKDSILSGSPVMLRVSIEASTTESIADVELWFSTLYDLSIDQLIGLREYIPKFSDSIKFHLKIKSKSCLNCPQVEKYRDCLSDGKYCPYAPVRPKNNADTNLDLLEDIGGRTLMMQSLLAKAVHQY